LHALPDIQNSRLDWIVDRVEAETESLVRIYKSESIQSNPAVGSGID
jgi:hypothetical protein